MNVTGWLFGRRNGGDSTGIGASKRKPHMFGQSDANPYAYPSTGLPPPETTCSDGDLFRGDVHMENQNGRSTQEWGIYWKYVRAFSNGNASHALKQVGIQNSGK